MVIAVCSVGVASTRVDMTVLVAISSVSVATGDTDTVGSAVNGRVAEAWTTGCSVPGCAQPTREAPRITKIIMKILRSFDTGLSGLGKQPRP